MVVRSSALALCRLHEQEAHIEATLDNIMRALRGGDDVRLVGFGTFLVSRRKATEARNPKTGKPIKLPASKRAKFRAGKSLKQAVNG